MRWENILETEIQIKYSIFLSSLHVKFESAVKDSLNFLINTD